MLLRTLPTLSSQEEVDSANNTNDQFKQTRKMLYAHLCLKINWDVMEQVTVKGNIS